MTKKEFENFKKINEGLLNLSDECRNYIFTQAKLECDFLLDLTEKKTSAYGDDYRLIYDHDIMKFFLMINYRYLEKNGELDFKDENIEPNTQDCIY